MTVVGVVLEWEDALVMAAVVMVARGWRRKGLAAAAVLLTAAAFPPWRWPTWWCCWSPLIPLWRGCLFDTDRNVRATANGAADGSVCAAVPRRGVARSLRRDLAEAFAIGFAMCWLTTGFVRDAVATRGALLQGSGCALFGLQVMLFPIALRRLAEPTILLTAAVMTGVAVLGEWLQASVMNGVAWSMMALCLPVAETPLAQWAAWITPFGVSALLYAVSFLWLPDRSQTGWRRWRGAFLAAGLLSYAWLGGKQIASSVTIQPLGFSAMLVQPHLRGGDGRWHPWVTLDQLTRESLERDGAVDLVVWPETSLADSRDPEPAEPPPEPAVLDHDRPVTLPGFQRHYQPEYGAACLVGVPLVSSIAVQRYGLDIQQTRRVNGACLADASGEVACHEKLSLLPIREGLPEWLDTPWVRRTLLPYYHLEAAVTPGRGFGLLPFTTQDGRTVRVAAAICYESHLPWLPQFKECNGADAVVHLTYDGDFAGHPAWADRHLLACCYRAIESRTWNLVCSTWSGSAIIDPAGRIVARLGADEGVLRSDMRAMQGIANRE